MQIVPHYLLGIEMSAMPKGTDMSHDAVHLEVMFTPLKTKSTAWPMARTLPVFGFTVCSPWRTFWLRRSIANSLPFLNPPHVEQFGTVRGPAPVQYSVTGDGLV
jgi:hypothetical protein